MMVKKNLYHGSPDKFEEFNLSRLGSHGSAQGAGVYTSDDRSLAEMYAHTEGESGYIYDLEVDLKKSLSLEKLTVSDTELSKIIDDLDRQKEFLSNYGDVEYSGRKAIKQEAMELLKDNDNDVDLFNDIATTVGDRQTTAEIFEKVADYNYVLSHNQTDKQADIYTILNPKNIDIKAINQTDRDVEGQPTIEDLVETHLIVHAESETEAAEKLFNGYLSKAITQAFSLEQLAQDQTENEEDIAFYQENMQWKDVADIECDNGFLYNLGNGYYADEFVPRDDTNIFAENSNLEAKSNEEFKNIYKLPTKIFDYNYLEIDKYEHGGEPAYLLSTGDREDPSYEFEPITTNILENGKSHTVFDTNNSPSIIRQLEKDGVIKLDGNSIASGYVSYPTGKINLKKLEPIVTDNQLKQSIKEDRLNEYSQSYIAFHVGQSANSAEKDQLHAAAESDLLQPEQQVLYQETSSYDVNTGETIREDDEIGAFYNPKEETITYRFFSPESGKDYAKSESMPITEVTRALQNNEEYEYEDFVDDLTSRGQKFLDEVATKDNKLLAKTNNLLKEQQRRVRGLER